MELNSSGAAAARAGLLGTWKLVGCTVTQADGASHHPYGAAPRGTIVYTSDGWMSCQMAPTEAGDPAGNAPPGNSAVTYSAYYGRFTIDEARHLVVHHVEGSSSTMVQGVQERHYTVDGNRLRLEAALGEAAVTVLWERP